MEVKIKIENVVASAGINQEIDLNAILTAFSYPTAEYRPETFPGLVYRIEEPKSAILVFNTGKFVCTGTKNEKDAKRAIKKVIRQLRKAGVIKEECHPEIAIQNIVASVKLGDNLLIDLDRAAFELHEPGEAQAMYEPDQFPGIVYRTRGSNIVLLIFRSAKLVCPGAKKEEDIPIAVERLRTKLEEKNLLIPATY